ncbi:MAG: hypothetical protein MRK00_09810 [Nitrosomonas sp.]|nr:hypothetical protein [Nitrosomonas sp.]
MLTDPFVTTGKNLKKVLSDKQEVERTLGQLKQAPDAIFIGHSHIDHLLDVHTAMLELPNWQNVPLFGSLTTQNILKGHKNTDLDKRVNIVDTKQPGQWKSIPISNQKRNKGYSIEYMALETAHTPHFSFDLKFFGIEKAFDHTFLDRKIEEPLKHLPRKLTDYPSGEVYNFLFKLKHNDTEFIVLMLGSPMPLADYPDSLPPGDIPIDVVIGLAASADNVEDYPKKQIARLKPRVVILSHFNNFLNKDEDEILHILHKPVVDIKQYLLDVQKIATYPNFEKILVPAITEFENDSIKNVVIVKPKK